MAENKIDLPEDLISVKPSNGLWDVKQGSAGNEDENGILGSLDESKDQPASDNIIPLSSQWLYAKSSDSIIGSSAAQAKDRWCQDGSQDKKDWCRALDVDNSHQWRKEERETSLLGRREWKKEGEREMECHKNERHANTASVGEFMDMRNMSLSERRNEVNGRNSVPESRRDSKWSSRWDPDDKEESRSDKRTDIDKDKDERNNDKHSFVVGSRAVNLDSHDKWRPRHRQEVQTVGFAPGRGRLKVVGTSLGVRPFLTCSIGSIPVNRSGNSTVTKDLRFHRASSGIDTTTTEASFVDMLKSTKKTTPDVDPRSGSVESTECGQTGKGGKKKGKKGRQIDPSLLGFKVHSNRIMMGEIQRLDD